MAKPSLALLDFLERDDRYNEQREKYDNYRAYCWNTIALCQHMNGKQSQAIKAQKKCLALRETDKYLADLERMQK